MKKQFSLLTLLLLFTIGIGQMWGAVYKTYSLSDLSNSGLTYEVTGLSGNDQKLNKGERKVEVPCASASGTLYLSGTSSNSGRYASIYKSNGTTYDADRQINMTNGYNSTGISFTSADILTDGDKYYIVFGSSADYKINKFKYTLSQACSSGGGDTPPTTTYSISYDCDGADSGCPSNASGKTALPNPLPAAPVKYGYSFDGWFTNSGKTDAAVAGAPLSDNATLYAKWTKVFAQDVDIEAYATSSTNLDNFKTWFTGKGYSYANLNALDNTTGSNNGAYVGIKTKSASAFYAFRVAANKRVTIKLGYMAEAAEMYINGVKNTTQALTGGSTSSGNNNYAEWTYDVTEESVFKLQIVNKNTCVLKAITIGDIPSVSDVATLSGLEIDGTAVEGFNASQTIISRNVPYGTAVANMPKITGATVTESHATYAISPATAPEWNETYKCYLQQVIVTAQNGTSKGYYHLRTYVDPKFGVELIKVATTGGTNKTVTGLYAGEGDVNLSDNKKMDKYKYIGFTLDGTTLQAGDQINVHTSSAATQGGSHVIFYNNMTDKNELYDTEAIGGKGNNMFTINAAMVDHATAYVYRSDADNPHKWNGYIDYLAVYRLMAPFIESFEIAGIGALNIDQENKTITAEVANDFDVTALTPTVKYWGNGGGAIDKAGAQNFTNPVEYTVSSAYADDATGDYAPVTYTVTITKVEPSATPTITTQPQGANYYEGATIAALEVVAEASDDGTLTYQWYLGADAIDGATAATYQPTVSEIGSYSYTCVVTNKKDDKPAASVTSDAAVVVIAEDPSCKAVGYGTTRDLALNSEVVIDATAGLKHKSSQSSYDTKKIAGESSLKTNKLGSSSAYYDIYTTEMNIGSIALSLTSGSNGSNLKYAVIFCKTAEFDASKILGIVEQTGGAGDEEQVINTPEVPLGTKLVRVMRYYKDADNNEYGQGSSSYIYYFRACLVEPAQEVAATVTAEPAGATYCPADAVSALSYELSIEEGATAAYQWYKGTDAIENATAATYTPTEAGIYTCKASLTKTGRLPKELTSAEATIVINTATAITAHVDAVGLENAEKTISVTADGSNLTYKWQACDVNGTVTDATVLGTEASLTITIAAEAKYYLATVTGACGTETQVVEARMWAEVERANVTGSRTWDWSTAGMGEVALENGSVEYLMANVSSAVPNTEAFRSDMLLLTGLYANRNTSNKVFQGYQVRFYTEVPGKVSLNCRAIHETMSVTINGTVVEESKGSDMSTPTTPFIVPAGWVTIVFDNISTGQYADEACRLQKIVFDATPDHERDVVVGNMGTVCLPNPSRAFGVKVYELAGKGEGCKVQFDELAENEVLEAGKAYVLVMTDTKAKFFYTSTSNPKTEANDDSAMKGNLSETPIEFAPLAEEAKNVVFFKDNAMWNAYETGLRIKQYRAYLQYDEVVAAPTSGPANGRRRVTLNLHQTEVATGFENLNASEKPVKLMIDGQIYILRGEKLYDATGRLVK